MIDVDNFKAANDTYGRRPATKQLHLIVRGITDCIRSKSRSSATAGTSFAVLPQHPLRTFCFPPGGDSPPPVETSPCRAARTSKPTVSIGGVCSAHPLADAIHRADLKMYDAKHRKSHVSVSIYPRNGDFDVE